MSALDVATVKRDFPILERKVNGKRLVYLDSASSAQKPLAVLDAMDDSYRRHYANIHRGVYTIAEEATAAFEAARRKVARFVNAPHAEEIVFTRNATESINLVAYSWARANLRAGDAIVLSHMEHHANVVPWQMLAAERGVELRWVPLTSDFRLDLSDLEALLDGARLLAISAMSNVLGTLNDIRPLADAAHAHGALVLVDACQYVPHVATDVQQWDADFIAFSSHKLCGPTGIGALWSRLELLEAMPPFLGGGEMIRDVRLDGFTTNDVPWKFEAGTPAIVEAVGFGAAVDYISAFGMDAVRAHEVSLTGYALEALRDRFGESLTIYGPTDLDRRGGAVSFLFDGIHAHDVSQVLDEDAVCVRAGHHCAKPLMRQLGVPATTRASFYVYNDEADVDALIEALAKAQKFFAV
ncbi:MAG: cysteine desulfurase / selenocysteine lyase [Actinomycetota bacterium]|jgi:cysteine desulfurase/selenocysteine lyase|nr:cysteine desulfurase / selenocysteine lyase [Actinomycetota bacterium]